MQNQIKQWLAEHAGEAAEFLSRLIQAASTAGRERQAQELMAARFNQMGMEIDIWEQQGNDLISHPCFCSPRTDFKDNPNVVGVLKGTGGGRSLIVNGHIDVVPPGEPGQWADSPWSGTIKDGRIYGRRGTVSAILAVEALVVQRASTQSGVVWSTLAAG